MSRVRWLRDRIYADFLMPSRLGELETLVRSALAQGYELHSLASFHEAIQSGADMRKGQHLILRHDVDTDPATAEAMWRVEKALGVRRASFFFRRSTADLELMRRMAADGLDVGYHFEEIATFARRHGLRSRDEVETHLPKIREEFSRNLAALRLRSGLPLTTTVAHGDFINQRVKVTNSLILEDHSFRQAEGILFEGYDALFQKNVERYYSDEAPPLLWRPAHPDGSLAERVATVSLLLHPRQWRSSLRANLRENSVRLAHEIHYRIRCASSVGGGA